MSAVNKNESYQMLMRLRPSELLDEDIEPKFYLSPPKILAFYEHNQDEINNAAHLPYFRQPKSSAYPIDLNKGFDQFVYRRKGDLNQCLGKIQKYVLESEKNILQPDLQEISSSFSKTRSLSKRKIVLCQRGVLTNIMLTPYRLQGSEYNDWTFYATRYCGILHIYGSSNFDLSGKPSTYHTKFAQYCFSDDPNLDPDTNTPADNNNGKCSIHHSTMKEFDLIYSAEVAGIISDYKIDVKNLDEVNVNEIKFILTKLLWSRNAKDDILKHPKLLLWWLQSYLSKINSICIGLKDADGFVRTPVKLYDVKDIPKNQIWKPHICIRFLHTVIALIEKTMADVNCPYTTYEFVYDSYAICIKMRIHEGKTKNSTLSEEYIKHCKQRTNYK